jgi:hypothetical protein
MILIIACLFRRKAMDSNLIWWQTGEFPLRAGMYVRVAASDYRLIQGWIQAESYRNHTHSLLIYSQGTQHRIRARDAYPTAKIAGNQAGIFYRDNGPYNSPPAQSEFVITPKMAARFWPRGGGRNTAQLQRWTKDFHQTHYAGV